MGVWSKITKFLVLTVFMLQPNFALCGKIDPLKAMSVEEFVEEAELDAKMMRLFDPNEDLAQCGSKICDLRKYKCIHAFRKDLVANLFGSTVVADAGYHDCVSKDQTTKSYFPNAWKVGWVIRTCDPKTEQCFFDEENWWTGQEVESISGTGSDGNMYNVVTGKNAYMTYGLSKGEKGAFFGCEVLPIRLFRYKKCFFCDLVGIIYNGGSILADISFLKIAKSFASLLTVGLAIWIALQVLGHISSLTKQDAPKFLGNLLRQSFKVLFAIVLLYYPKNIFDYAFNPLLNAGLEFGEEALVSNALGNLRISKAQAAHGSPGGEYLSNETYREIEYFVKTVNAALSQMQAVGGSMMCAGGRVIAMNIDPFTRNETTKKTQIVDGLAILTQGALMVVFGWLLSIAFVFYLLDAIIQMGVVGGLLPFMVAAWPFKVTSNYTKVGVDMFMNSVFTFAFIGLIVSIDITLIDEAMALNGGGLREIAQAFHDNDIVKILKLTDITGMGLLILLFCCIYGFKFLGEASSLAGKFASGALTGKGALAPKIATMGASAAKNLALGATKDLRKAAGDKMGAGIKAVANSPYNLAKAGINKLRNRKSKDKE